MEEFYDYLRYAISMAQLNLPRIVTDNIKEDLYNYINNMSIEDLEMVDILINAYDMYFNDEINIIQLVNKRIKINKDCELISRVFSKELGELSVKQEKLIFIKDFLDNIKNMVDIKKESLLSKNRG